MFDNIFSSLKIRAKDLNDSLKSKSKKLTTNIDSIKNIFNKPKSQTTYTVAKNDHNDYFTNEYLSPRAYVMDNCNSQYKSINENVEWMQHFPSKFDEQNIIDRFLKVITLNEDVIIRAYFFNVCN